MGCRKVDFLFQRIVFGSLLVKCRCFFSCLIFNILDFYDIALFLALSYFSFLFNFFVRKMLATTVA